MRTALAKSLQRRSNAIRTAVKKYNTAALALNPPRPVVDWSKVIHYSFMDEFDVLRLSKNDFSRKKWANSAIRDTMRDYQKLQRSHEEVTRCTIEVRRLHTSIVDEHRDFTEVLSHLREKADPMCAYMEDFMIRRRRVNAVLWSRIQQIYILDGFTGDKSAGVRKGTKGKTCDTGNSSEMTGIHTGGTFTLVDDDAYSVASDDEVSNLNSLVDFLSVSNR